MRAHLDILFDGERAMNARARALAGRGRASARRLQRRTIRLQGWVEADLIFVGPDETGRVQTLAVREGDPVDDRPTRCSRSMTICSRPTWRRQTATVTNAKQTFERAQALLKTECRHPEGL